MNNIVVVIIILILMTLGLWASLRPNKRWIKYPFIGFGVLLLLILIFLLLFGYQSSHSKLGYEIASFLFCSKRVFTIFLISCFLSKGAM